MSSICKSFLSLVASDQIQLIGIIVSLIVGIVSIVIAICTLRQNHKMLEESSRPYITISCGTTFFRELRVYMILKNFGSCGARITRFKTDFDLEQIELDESGHPPFSNVEGTYLAPGQSIEFIIDQKKAPFVMRFFIEYESATKSYSDEIAIDQSVFINQMHLRANTPNKDLQVISFALQDIAEKLL